MDILAQGLINSIKTISGLARDARSTSLVDYTKGLRVEPTVLLEDRMMLLEYRSDLLQTLTSIYTAYYIMAASIAGNSNSVEILAVLDKLNPDRDPVNSGLNTLGVLANKISTPLNVSTSGYEEGLPSMENLSQGVDQFNGNAHDANVKLGGNVTKDNLTTPANLAVGRIVDLTFSINGSNVPMTVAIRLRPVRIPHQGMPDVLAVGQERKTRKERWQDFKFDERTVKEMITCVDLVDAHRKALMSDETNTYTAAIERERRGFWSTLLSGAPSVAVASNIAVITKETANVLESKIRGRLDRPRDRNKVFENTMLMLLVVVDTERDAIRIYHRGIAEETLLTPRDIKNRSGKETNDVSEILKAYQMGNSPSF